MVKLSRAKDLFNSMSIHRQIKVWAAGELARGSYLVIEQTEDARHRREQRRTKKGASSQEENALINNLMWSMKLRAC